MSDEVSQFLEQVERLRGQQIEEDEVRAKELEDYLAAKRERQARREGLFAFRLPFPHTPYSSLRCVARTLARFHHPVLVLCCCSSRFANSLT